MRRDRYLSGKEGVRRRNGVTVRCGTVPEEVSKFRVRNTTWSAS